MSTSPDCGNALCQHAQKTAQGQRSGMGDCMMAGMLEQARSRGDRKEWNSIIVTLGARCRYALQAMRKFPKPSGSGNKP